ncbi:MAG: bifunctional adenosylcobinamide kinase/adenosylcobinamide-phosphate guanylyltransferase [Candidatus Promineifilaceae bacterium]
MAQLTLILGGARSGKSRYGEQLAQASGEEVLFVATAQAFDEEMAERIGRHRANRPSHWRTVEAPLDAAATLGDEPVPVVLLDCVTLLVSNIILELGDELEEELAQTAVNAELDTLLEKLADWEGHWIVISNEVGLGIVPENRLARIYRDVLGRANQRLAAAATTVILMVAGLPLVIKER